MLIQVQALAVKCFAHLAERLVHELSEVRGLALQLEKFVSGLHSLQLLEDVGGDCDERLEKFKVCTTLGVLLVALLDGLLELSFLDVIEHELNSQILIAETFVDSVAIQLHQETVRDHPMTHSQIERCLLWTKSQVLKYVEDVIVRRQTATRQVACFARHVSSLSHVLVVVWIVNASCLHLAGAPRKSSVALCAVHLVTAFDLENHGCTLGTRLGVLVQQLGSLYILRFAFM